MPAPANPKRRRAIVAVAIALLAALAAAGAWALGTGVLAPANAAAKYGTFGYLRESEVTDYILTYQRQMGYDNEDSDQWAQFLASNNLTPDRLRMTTITQILANKAVEQRCRQLGITATDDEVDAQVERLKNLYTLGDDQIWQSTLDLYGQSERGVREAYRLQLLKEKLCTQEVPMPTPSDEQVRAAVENFVQARLAQLASEAPSSEQAQAIVAETQSVAVRHSYCLAIPAASGEVGLAESERASSARQEFIDGGSTLAAFERVLAAYSGEGGASDDGGNRGWDCDLSDASEAYARVLQGLAAGAVSSVFTDGDAACFAWVDQEFDIACTQGAVELEALAGMPDTLRDYFVDAAAFEQWQRDSSAYVQGLAAAMDVTLYPMPASVPYNVDMSAYEVPQS